MNAGVEPRLRTEPLRPQHDRSGFSSGMTSLDRYLRDLAGHDPRRAGAAVFVLADEANRVLGFYTLSAMVVLAEDLPPELGPLARGNSGIPATLLRRLAFDRSGMGRGYGERLFLDAFFRAWVASRTVPSAALVADASDDPLLRSCRFYGFREFPDQRNRLFLPMRTLARVFGE